MRSKRKHSLNSHLPSQQSTLNYPLFYGDSWEEQAFAEDAAGAVGGCVWPPRSYSCNFCKREFKSAQALGGHMNVHRRDRARLKQSSSPEDIEILDHYLQNHHNHIPCTYTSQICTMICNPNPESPTSPRNEILDRHHQNHSDLIPYTSLGVQYPNSQICTMICNSNPKSTPSRVSPPPAQDNCDESISLPIFSSPILEEHQNKASIVSSPPWSNLVSDKYIRIPDPKNKFSVAKEDCAALDLSKRLNLGVRQNSSRGKEEDLSCKRRRTVHDSTLLPSMKSNSTFGHLLQSKAVDQLISSSTIEDLDLELRLGGWPKAEIGPSPLNTDEMLLGWVGLGEPHIARMGRKPCEEPSLTLTRRSTVFPTAYNQILDVAAYTPKMDLGKLEYGSKETEKRVEKMAKLISATSQLYLALESLSEMEISERKLKQWKLNTKAFQSQSVNMDLFNQKISHQRKQVRHYKETSLWNQTFDKSVGLMARIVCVVYARLCFTFGRVGPDCCLFEPRREQVIITRSGPIPTASKPKLVRFHSQKPGIFSDSGSEYRVFNMTGSDTMVGSGLALRYANVILLAEKYLDTAVTIGSDARDDLYQMLPVNLKILVKSKLSKNVTEAPAEEEDGEGLAEGWREAMGDIMRWLTPVARDTVRWQAERNFEKMRFESRPTALLVQTLHFSDREKMEAAVADVLVGLSCIYQYENRWYSDGDGETSAVVGRCSFDGVGWR